MGYVGDQIIALARQFFPSGRAFKMPIGSVMYKVQNALSKSEERAVNDARSILDSALPDNPNFTADDATDWEKRLGLITNPMVPLDDRKAAIIRKMNHPGTIPARENYRFLEYTLQAAGFNVYVYENRFDDGMGGFITKTPQEVSGVSPGSFQYGDIQYGDGQYGDKNFEQIVNYIDPELDADFNVGSNLKSTFFVGGTPIGTFADVSAERLQEFRQLILKTKPLQTVGFLFINYV